MRKQFYRSKTLWVVVITFVAVVAQEVTGQEVIPAEAQVGILAVVMVILRAVTRSPIGWEL